MSTNTNKAIELCVACHEEIYEGMMPRHWAKDHEFEAYQQPLMFDPITQTDIEASGNVALYRLAILEDEHHWNVDPVTYDETTLSPPLIVQPKPVMYEAFGLSVINAAE